MKRIILPTLPIDFTPIQGVAYNGKLDLIVDDSVKIPADALYVSRMETDGSVTEISKKAGFTFEHHFAGWDKFNGKDVDPKVEEQKALELSIREAAEDLAALQESKRLADLAAPTKVSPFDFPNPAIK